MIGRLGAGETVAGSLAAGRLATGGILLFVMSAVAPLTIVAGLIATAFAVTGNVGLPAAFWVVGLLLGVFSVGYVAMSRHLPHAGAFYAYTAHGLGGVAGIGTAWVSLLAYNLLQVGLYGIVGAAVNPLLADWVGWTVPWWVIALAAWALVGVLGVNKVELNRRILAVLLLCEIALIGVYDVAWLLHPAHGLDLSVLSPHRLTGPGVGAVLAIAVLAGIGFESAVVFAEEARNPRRTIPAATYAAVAAIAVLYTVSAWGMVSATGTDQIVTASSKQGPDLVFTLAGARLGQNAATVGHVLFATSVIAAMISFHSTTARYLFALGREGVFPSRFGRTTRMGSPRGGSLAQTGLAFVVIIAFAVGGRDPVLDLFYLAGTSGALGVLILLVVASVAIARFFAHDRRGESTWHTRIAPLTAITGLSIVLALVLDNLATLLGVAPSSPLRWGVPAAYAATAVLGCGYGGLLKTHRPRVYAAIGHGAKAALPAPPDPALGHRDGQPVPASQTHTPGHPSPSYRSGYLPGSTSQYLPEYPPGYGRLMPKTALPDNPRPDDAHPTGGHPTGGHPTGPDPVPPGPSAPVAGPTADQQARGPWGWQG